MQEYKKTGGGHSAAVDEGEDLMEYAINICSIILSCESI